MGFPLKGIFHLKKEADNEKTERECGRNTGTVSGDLSGYDYCFAGIDFRCNTKTEIFKKYIDEYNKKFDGEKLQKSQYFIDGYFNDKTLTELYIKYKQFEYLKAYELIDFEGNINELYSCEYEFIWNFLIGYIAKYNLFKIILIIFLLQ